MAGWSITRPRVFDLLSPCSNILLAGCGGGYDVLSSMPLYFALRDQGKTVHLANLSFTCLDHTGAPTLCKDCYVVNSSLKSKLGDRGYFPELYLARWLKEIGEGEGKGSDISIYSFYREIGVKRLSEAYSKLASTLKLDAIVLVDGGTDSLMFGSEIRMGTPSEDHCSMVSVSTVTSVPVRLLICLGFGVDSFHGVSHGRFLENVTTVERTGGYYGSFSVSRLSREGKLFMDAYKAVSSYMQPSIVCASITDAMLGHFGNHHSTSRTRSSELFINPLMCLYWCFDLLKVVENIPYSEQLLKTASMSEVSRVIAQHHSEVIKRGEIRKDLPLPM